MFQLPGYKILKLMEKNDNEEYYEGYSNIEEKKVIIRVLKLKISLKAFEEDVYIKLKRTQALGIQSILKPIYVGKSGDIIYAIYDPIMFQSLRQLNQKHQITIEQFLFISNQLTSILMELHKKKIMIGSFNPSQILVDLQKEQVYLSTYSFHRQLETKTVLEPFILSNISYSSPELTGRMGKSADFRSDLYSLGVLFYELLTKQLPFEQHDLLELLHSHFSKIPVSPTEMDNSIPLQFSKIVLKLLEKIPEKRYQTARGLKRDLEICSEQWEIKADIVPFIIGKSDSRSSFHSKSLLIGRDDQIDELLSLFRSIKRGAKEYVLIKGNSGVGKTAVVQEFKNRIVYENVIFVSGKWDQFERSIPYASIVQAFKEFLRIILSQGEKSVKVWKKLFIDKLGNRLRIIVDIIPELQWVIGDQIEEEKIDVLERHNSLFIAFQKLLLVITSKQPFILFIDDIQWADQASMDLLQYLIKDNEIPRLLIILASRDEKNQNTRTKQNLKLLRQLDGHKLHINPLGEQEINKWLIQTYQFNKNIKPLSTFVYTVSRGNPFFIMQLLMNLEKENQIFLNPVTNTYDFQLGQLSKSFIHQDVLSLLYEKLQTLPERIQQSLQFAACLGSKFMLTELSISTKIDRRILLKDLYIAVEEGFIFLHQIHDGSNEIVFEFIHDKVQQAIYSNLNEDKKIQLHYQIGKRLLGHLQSNSKKKNLFKILDHLNLSVHLLSKFETITLVSLNVKGGNQAKNSAAFEAAYRYFSTGKSLLSTNCWEDEYDLSYQIYVGLGESAYLNSRFEEAEEAFEILLEKAKTNEEKLSVYNLKLILYTHLNRVEEAVEAGKKGLKLFGWRLDRPITKWDIVKELILIRLKIKKKKPHQLLELPPMTDQGNKLIMQSLINMNAPTYHVDKNLATYLMLRAFRFTLKHGNTDISALVFNNYALILSAGFGKLGLSYEFGRLAITHVENSKVVKLKARVYFVYGSFVNHWKHPIERSLEYLVQSQKYSLESGNFSLAGAGSSFICLTKLLTGESLENVLEEVKSQIALLDKIQYALSKDYLLEFKAWIEQLLSERNFEYFPLSEHDEDDSAFIMHYTLRLKMYYILGMDNKAKQILTVLNEKITKNLVLVIAPEFYFYHTLWLCKCKFFESETRLQQKQTIKYLKRNLKLMKKWSIESPSNYTHKYLLMKAEVMNAFNSRVFDERWYEQAFENAHANGFTHEAAIICECAGNYYLKKGFVRRGRYYIREAYEYFAHWGAKQKLNQLVNQFHSFFPIKENSSNVIKGLDLIDLDSLLKASRTISSEIVLEQVINKMMKIVIENAGASKGHLFLKEGKNLYLAMREEEEREPNNEIVYELEELTDQLSVQIVHFVQTSHEPIVLNNASDEGMFKDDPYIQSQKVKSIICLPILHQSRMLGILYLENNLVTHAFTEKKILLLTTLASQAAISIQNARLYSSLEEKVKARTLELEKANKELAQEEKLRLELISNISHDLRNPIASIQGFIEAIIDGIVVSPEKQLTYLKRSKEKLHALNRLIQDLFDLSQLQYGSLSFKKEEVRADKLFHLFCEQHEWDIVQKGLQFGQEIISNSNVLFPMVEVDIGRMEQVVSNIVSNSLKHTTSGKITFIMVCQKDNIMFEISDTGEGIADNELEKIFERAFTNRKTAYVSGNGLGLSISKEIIAYHNGTIWAESNLGKGTSIFFTIPILQMIRTTSMELEQQK